MWVKLSTEFRKSKKNLGVFELVGITELFNESLLLLKNKFNWTNIEYVKKNVTKSRPRLSEVPTAITKKIEKNNELDIELFKYVKSNFIRQLKDL